jgi:hypothetical protein
MRDPLNQPPPTLVTPERRPPDEALGFLLDDMGGWNV